MHVSVEQSVLTWEAVVGLLYGFVCLCLIAPPEEFVQAGLTIQNVMGTYFGDSSMDFIGYHIRRTSATLMFHTLLPAGYALVIMCKDPATYVYNFFRLSGLMQACIALCMVLPICTAVMILYWYHNKWSPHPIARSLAKLAPPQSGWRSVASSVNIEIRRPDNFTSGHYSRQVLVTENWILKLSTYDVYVAHQSDSVLNLHTSRELNITYDSPHGMQILDIDVTPVIQSKFKPFVIKLDSMHYQELKDRVTSHIVTARSVVVKQTVSDRFVQEFSEHVDNNMKYTYRPEQGQEPDQCIGCMQAPAGIKLVKLCAEPEEGDCQQCYCRPLWCINCIGKWFCSRQNQGDPSNWMAGKAPCPMCRAVFCLADVCHLQEI